MRKLSRGEIPRADPSQLNHIPRHPVVCVLENVRSLHNVGSIFRTADAAAIERLYLTGITGTPEHRGLYKTALGAEEMVPWSYAPDAGALVARLRAEGYRIAVLEITDRPTRIEELGREDFPLCLVVGNELDGVSDRVMDAAELAIELPQYGAKQSFNASVACGIALFNLVQRYRALYGSGNGDPR